MEEHDKNLEYALNRVRDINMTLNKEKCVFRTTEVTYLGETVSSEG